MSDLPKIVFGICFVGLILIGLRFGTWASETYQITNSCYKSITVAGMRLVVVRICAG